MVEVCESAGFTPRIDFATDDYPAVVGLVSAGLGVAVLPQLAIESVRPRGARTVALEPAVRREIACPRMCCASSCVSPTPKGASSTRAWLIVLAATSSNIETTLFATGRVAATKRKG